MDDFLAKPVSLSALASTLGRWVEGGVRVPATRGAEQVVDVAVLDALVDDLGSIEAVLQLVGTFVDEMHTVVGAGAGGDSAMDASNMLKPALARGELRTIAATTWSEFKKYFEKDPALTRRFEAALITIEQRRLAQIDAAKEKGADVTAQSKQLAREAQQLRKSTERDFLVALDAFDVVDEVGGVMPFHVGREVLQPLRETVVHAVRANEADVPVAV